MFCLSASSALPRAGEQAELHTQSKTCRVLKTTLSEKTRHVMTLNESQEYMLLFLLPSEAGSFVSWRTLIPTGESPVDVVQGTCSKDSPGVCRTAFCDEISICDPLSPGSGPTPGYDCFSPTWSSAADPFTLCDAKDESTEGEPVLSSVKSCSGSQIARYGMLSSQPLILL